MANNVKKDELPINRNIRVSELMVIGPNGEQMGSKKLEDALTLANYAGLDLVLMSGNNPQAVGKIMDYNKYRYEKQKKQKEALKTQRASNKEMKEYQFSVKIDIGDFNTRKKNAEEYLLKGHKIKATLRFKGRQMTHTDLGKDVLERFANELAEIAVVETSPKLEGRTMTMILAPKK
ncbi:MAG: translation initiation factor IF-3 [Bacilli bacterium]|nr:translation initiation factor IF-3 [Bacilli bacterium]